MDCIAIIPARYASSRFPGKLLASLAGRPLIQQVVECVVRVPGIDSIVVATDDERIAAVARETPADVVLSSGDFASGTDRVADAASRYSADVIVNVQGDELLLDGAAVGAAIARFSESGAELGTLRAPLTEWQDLRDPNVVKVVIDDNERALYFSRAPLPFSRSEWEAAEGSGEGTPEHSAFGVGADNGPATPAWAHLGVYFYRPEALASWAALPPSRLEIIEGLEQLRVLEAGRDMQTYLITKAIPSVNTVEDLERARIAMSARDPQT